MTIAMMERTGLAGWISTTKALQILGVPRASFHRLIEAGELSSRRLPGCRVLVLRTEVERLAALTTRTAREDALVTRQGA